MIGSQHEASLVPQPHPAFCPAATRRAASPYFVFTCSLMSCGSMLSLLSSTIDDLRCLCATQTKRDVACLYVHDHSRCLGKLGQAVAVHAVIHKRAAAFRLHETSISKDFQVVRNRRLSDGKVLYDVANAYRLPVRGEEIENADRKGIGEGFEPAGILARANARKLRSDGRRPATATIPRDFRFARHAFPSRGATTNYRLIRSSTNVNE